jgi:hypothetical protein
VGIDDGTAVLGPSDLLQPSRPHAVHRLAATSLHLGYSMLFASDVARAGKHVNRNIQSLAGRVVNGTSERDAGGAGTPGFAFDSSSFWAQGVSLGSSVQFLPQLPRASHDPGATPNPARPSLAPDDSTAKLAHACRARWLARS